MVTPQPGILAPAPLAARYLTFTQRPGVDPTSALRALSDVTLNDEVVCGLSASAIASLGRNIEGLHSFPDLVGIGVEVPSTPGSLWIYLRGEDRGELLHRGRKFEALVIEAFELRQVIDGFRYKETRDLTGYIDGTENPEGDRAHQAAFAADGSSYVVVQQWTHDLDTFLSLEEPEQDDIFGRSKEDNVELPDAPPSAHVKRTAQESFDPEAFLVRRSLPWAEGDAEGLVFVAFGKSFDAFEALLGRMIGKEDGIVDSLFRFSQPVTGSYFWCPPVKDGRLDLSALWG